MLTVTVIAVAAVVVINISEGYGDQKTVDIRVTPVSGTNNFSVVLTGGADAAELTKIQGRLEGGGQISSPIENPKVGLPEERKLESTIPGEVLLTLIGTFADGTVQTVYQSLVNVQATGFSLGSAVYPERPTVVGTQEPVVVRGTLTITAKDQVMTKDDFVKNIKNTEWKIQKGIRSADLVQGDKISSVTLTLKGKDIVPSDAVIQNANGESVEYKGTIYVNGTLTDTEDISTYVTVPEKAESIDFLNIYFEVKFNLDLMNKVPGASHVEINVNSIVYNRDNHDKNEIPVSTSLRYSEKYITVSYRDVDIPFQWILNGWVMTLTVKDAIGTPLAKATYDIDIKGNIRKRLSPG
ncbi:hypothetical protein O0S09_05885 [Methanocorpusculum sp. CW153]|uniref:Uncharacterized protein n=1 Tax=Methanocorpusculum vombati TaxID=3002864 RepID=A0ABT4ILY9_9EURY|nr:hypothetical protein [Methanocorpusculum vombati]